MVELKQKGWTTHRIKEATGVSEATQRRYCQRLKKGISLGVTKSNRSLYNNGNSKITPEYIRLLKECVVQNDSLNTRERREELNKKTGICLGKSRFASLLKDLNITRKKKTFLYEDASLPINQQRREQFIKDHTPKKGIKSLLLSSSTDENGFDNQAKRMHGWTMVRTEPASPPGSKISHGKSYRNNKSRCNGTVKKHANFRLHVIATICLDPFNPVPAFQVSTEYTNGSVYSNFILNRELPQTIKFDIIDRHGAHKSTTANERRGDMSVVETYQNVGILPSFIPAGMPQLNPIEILFAFLTKELESEAPKYNRGGGWSKEDIVKVLNEAREKVTFEMVQSWYSRTYTEMYPYKRPPIYLRQDIEHSIVQKEMERQRKQFESRNHFSKRTRKGRIIKQRII